MRALATGGVVMTAPSAAAVSGIAATSAAAATAFPKLLPATPAAVVRRVAASARLASAGVEALADVAEVFGIPAPSELFLEQTHLDEQRLGHRVRGRDYGQNRLVAALICGRCSALLGALIASRRMRLNISVKATLAGEARDLELELIHELARLRQLVLQPLNLLARPARALAIVGLAPVAERWFGD
eukprot:scaffold319514_cov21-Tisochrysis_lutea.AAC.1